LSKWFAHKFTFLEHSLHLHFDEDKIMCPCSVFSRLNLRGQSGHSYGSAATTPRSGLAVSEVGHMPHGNMVVVVNRIAGQWPPPSQHRLPMIRKEASFPCFQKLASPHGGGRIQGAFGIAIVVTQIHCSGEPRLSCILLQRCPMLCCIAAWVGRNANNGWAIHGLTLWWLWGLRQRQR
jgi:hypothetical protein